MKPTLTRADIETLSPNTLLKAEYPPNPYGFPDSSLGWFHSTKEQVLETSKSKCFSQLHLVSLRQFLARCILLLQLTILSKRNEKIIYHTPTIPDRSSMKAVAQQNPFESR